MNKLLATTALIALMTTGVSGLAHAQTATATPPAPPAVSGDPATQVSNRIEMQKSKINADAQAGKLTPEQAARDEKSVDKTSAKLSKDEAKNGGTITVAEQAKLNKHLDKNHKRIHHQVRKNSVTPVATGPITTPAQ